MGVRDTNTPLFTLKDRVSQNLLVTQTVLDNIHWTWNANLRLEMRVVHSFRDSKWLWLPLLLSFYLSVPTQTDAERCSCFCGTGRPLCVPAQRQSSHETRERMNTLLAPAHPRFLPIAWTKSEATSLAGCNGNWNIMEHFCRLNWTLCPYHLLNHSQNKPEFHGLLHVYTHLSALIDHFGQASYKHISRTLPSYTHQIRDTRTHAYQTLFLNFF